MAVAFDELAGSPSFKFDGGKLTINRSVLIDWSNITAYMEELYPAATQIGNVNVNKGGAAFPGNTRFRISSFSVDPFHQDEAGAVGLDEFGVLKHEFAVVKMAYNVPLGSLPATSQQANFDPKEMLQHHITSGGQFLELPDSGYVWAFDDKPVPTKTLRGVFIPTSEHQITDKFVLAPYWTKLEGLKGTVNASAFTLRGFSYPKESLLYLGYDATQTVMTDGEQAWTLVYKFSVKMVPAADATVVDDPDTVVDDTTVFTAFGSTYGGHNHRWREAVSYTEGFDTFSFPAGWYRITSSIDGEGPYRTSNFSELFQAAPVSEIDE